MHTNPKASRTLLRKPSAFGAMGFANSTGYLKIQQGLFLQPVRCGSSSVWPSDEIAKIQAAYVAGKSEAEIRALVSDLHAARKAGA